MSLGDKENEHLLSWGKGYIDKIKVIDPSIEKYFDEPYNQFL